MKIREIGKVLWWSEQYGEGQLKSQNGKKYYFNTSVWKDILKPKRDQDIAFRCDGLGVICASDLINVLNKGLKHD